MNLKSLFGKSKAGRTPVKPVSPVQDPPATQASPETDVWVEEESTTVTDKVSFWVGVVLGILTILLAWQVKIEAAVALTNAEADILSGIASSVNTLPVEAYLCLVAFLGLILGMLALPSMVGSRPAGVPWSRIIVAAAGLILCALSAVVYVMDYYGWLSSVLPSLSPPTTPGEAIWPRGAPAWYYILPTLGTGLVLASLALARTGSKWNLRLGVICSMAPAVLFSLPFVVGSSSMDILRVAPMLMCASGFFMMLSGFRLHSSLSDVAIEKLCGMSATLLALALLVDAIMAGSLLESGRALSSYSDWMWALPLFATSVLSFIAFVGLFNSNRRGAAHVMSIVAIGIGLTVSAESFLFFMLGDAGFLSFDRTYWLAPMSVLGMALLMGSLAFSREGTVVDRTLAVVASVVPLFLLTWITYTNASDVVQPSLLTGGSAFWTYALLAAVVYVSGMQVETKLRSYLMERAIYREKSRLMMVRTYKILSQVVRNPMGLIGLVILVFFGFIAAFGPALAPYEVDATSLGQFDKNQLESPDHFMGTDSAGYDIFSELLYGARTSIIVGVFAAVISSFLGAVVGLYSGFVGGWKDEAVMRVNDVVLSIPWLVLMIIIAAFMGTINLAGIILIIGLTGWSGTARLVRAQVMSIRERQYIERAKAIGAADGHIISKHVLPNVFPLVFANTILTVAGSILAEASLSFLNMRPVDVVTWGTMLSYASQAGAFQIGLEWWIVAPGLCIVALVLGFTLLGYALDEVMNPKLRKR